MTVISHCGIFPYGSHMSNTNVPPDVDPAGRRLWLAADAAIDQVMTQQALLHEELASSPADPVDAEVVADLSLTHDAAAMIQRAIEEDAR